MDEIELLLPSLEFEQEIINYKNEYPYNPNCIEGNNAKAYSLFVNSQIIYAGDKDNVNEALKAIFYKAKKSKYPKKIKLVSSGENVQFFVFWGTSKC